MLFIVISIIVVIAESALWIALACEVSIGGSTGVLSTIVGLGPGMMYVASIQSYSTIWYTIVFVLLYHILSTDAASVSLNS